MSELKLGWYAEYDQKVLSFDWAIDGARGRTEDRTERSYEIRSAPVDPPAVKLDPEEEGGAIPAATPKTQSKEEIKLEMQETDDQQVHLPQPRPEDRHDRKEAKSGDDTTDQGPHQSVNRQRGACVCSGGPFSFLVLLHLSQFLRSLFLVAPRSKANAQASSSKASSFPASTRPRSVSPCHRCRRPTLTRLARLLIYSNDPFAHKPISIERPKKGSTGSGVREKVSAVLRHRLVRGPLD